MSFEIQLTFQVHNLDQLVYEGPMMPMKRDDGELSHEALTLVGDVRAPASAREQLECYAISLALALFDETEQRWSRCLFSEPAADTLVELGAEGQFPYHFEAVPSAGYLATLEAVGAGRVAPAMPLLDWVMPAPLDALARAVRLGLIQSSWLRRVLPAKSDLSGA